MRALVRAVLVAAVAATVSVGVTTTAQAQPTVDLRPCSQHGPTTQIGCLVAHLAARAGSSDLDWYRIFLD